MDEIVGMILAAGKGERLKPLTDFVPKPLLLIEGKPLILKGIEMMKETGIKKIVINLHHLKEEIRNFLGDGKIFGVSITYSEEDQLLGTGGGVKKALPFLNGKTVCIMNSDIVIDIHLKEVYSFHRRNGNPLTIVVKKGLSRDLSLKNYNVEEFFPDEEKEAWTFCGITFAERDVLEEIPEGKGCLVRNFFVPLLRRGVKISAFIYNGRFIDAGTPDGLRMILEK